MTTPNILWLTTHDINPHLGAYAGVYPGAEHAVTPHLDRLAAEGARFDRAFAAAPICGPSRSSIMTGCYPTAIGTMHMRTKAVPPVGVRLLPEYFRENGYYTTCSSFTDFQVPTPLSAFDEWGENAHWRNRPSPDTPFFAAFHGLITHESQIYLDDAEFTARTPRVRDEDRHRPEDVELPPYHPDTEVFRRSWARYLDLITEMDSWIGTLLDQLEEDGLMDNTIVVFWSDHGRGMPRAKRWTNDSGLHEPLIIRWPGRIEPGTVDRRLVHLMDLAPSMLRACGFDVPDAMHAVPFLDTSGLNADPHREFVISGSDRMGELEDMTRTVRDERYRYIRHFHPDRSPMQHCDYPDSLWTWREMRRLASQEAGQRAQGLARTLLTDAQRQLTAPSKDVEELYDIETDPHELVNLAEDPGHRDVMARMRCALEEWSSAHEDLGLLAEDDLLERWRPGGQWQITPEPQVIGSGDDLRVTTGTPGAVIVWTDEGPPARSASGKQEPHIPQGVDRAREDERHWRLLSGAWPLPRDRSTWVRAVRLGWQESDEVLVAAR